MFSFSIKKNFLKFLYSVLVFIVILEFFSQSLIHLFNKPILIFNPYCDQSYWNNVETSSINKDVFQYHPELTLIKKSNDLAFNFDTNKFYSIMIGGQDPLMQNQDIIDEIMEKFPDPRTPTELNDVANDLQAAGLFDLAIKFREVSNELALAQADLGELILYGSSFIDHKYFLPHFQNDANYAVKSYGLDQIFQSYKLTKDRHPNALIIFGFLLEDLDRVLFEKRNYPKIKFIDTRDVLFKHMKNKNLDPSKFENYLETINIPVQLNKRPNNEFFIYSYNLIKNLTFLSLNKFDHKRSECHIDFKKNIFKFFINEISKNADELNQEIIFVTFNFQDDIIESNWRYQFISDYLSTKNIIHLDTRDVLLKHMKNNNLDPSKYYSNEDFHLNKLGNEIITSELKMLIKQHK